MLLGFPRIGGSVSGLAKKSCWTSGPTISKSCRSWWKVVGPTKRTLRILSKQTTVWESHQRSDTARQGRQNILYACGFDFRIFVRSEDSEPIAAGAPLPFRFFWGRRTTGIAGFPKDSTANKQPEYWYRAATVGGEAYIVQLYIQ